METLEWVLVGICAVELVIHLIRIAEMSKELDEDEEDEDAEIH